MQCATEERFTVLHPGHVTVLRSSACLHASLSTLKESGLQTRYIGSPSIGVNTVTKSILPNCQNIPFILATESFATRIITSNRTRIILPTNIVRSISGDEALLITCSIKGVCVDQETTSPVTTVVLQDGMCENKK